MSVKVMAAVFEQSQSKGSARLVLLAMANEAHSDGSLTAYKRSQAHLARLTNLDVETIRRAIRSLCELGELQVLVAGVGRESSDYRILLPGIGEIPQSESPQTEGTDPSGSPPRDLNVRGQTPPDEGSIIPLLPVDTPLAPVGRSRANRKAQLPSDFELTEERRAKAIAIGVPAGRVDVEFEKFVDWHDSKASTMANWDAAWRTWARNYRGPRDAGKTSGLDPSVVRALAEAGGT